jgi:drug/metabolite transporter (DMT)-like permease
VVSKELSIAILAGLGAMLTWGGADFFAKKSVDRIGDYATLFWSQAIGGGILLVVLILTAELGQLNRFDFFALLGLGIIDAFSWIYFYKALEKGEVSILSPIFATWAAGSIIISVFIFGEIISGLNWLLLSLILFGVILISLNVSVISKRAKAKLVKGLPEVIIATVLFSVWVALWGHFSSGKPWIFYTFVMRMIIVVVLFAVCRYKEVSFVVRDKSIWKLLFLIGLFDVFAYSLVSYGFSNTAYVSIVAVLSSAFSLPTIILARIFLNERMSKIQIIGSIFILAGVAALSLQ